MNQNAKQKENVFLNILMNVVAPAIVLNKFSDDKWLGYKGALAIAVALPTAYWIYDYIKRRKNNVLSIIGLVSVILSGGLGLFKLNGFWFAVKDAAVPGLIGLFCIISVRIKKPFIKTIFYNDQVFNVDLVDQRLRANSKIPEFDTIMFRTSLIIGSSFFLSAVLNFFLAIWILKSEPGTTQFTQELGKMHAVSYPVIVIPNMIVLGVAIWYLIRGIRGLTGLTSDEIFVDHKR